MVIDEGPTGDETRRGPDVDGLPMTVPVPVPIATVAEEDANFQREVPYAMRADAREDDTRRLPAVTPTQPGIHVIVSMMILLIILAVCVVFVFGFVPILLK